MASIARLFCFLLFLGNLLAGELNIEKIEPPNWWTGMKLNRIQLMIYGKELTNLKVSFNTEGIIVDKIHEMENTDYAFIDIIVSSEVTPGDYLINFQNKSYSKKVTFPIYERELNSMIHQGFDNSDVIYLITPDRFANGDQDNDEAEGILNDFDPDKPYARHGGDIQGIINQLDYLDELGITAIWINPLVENNTNISYHGYSATNFYKIDPRFGTNELYKELVNNAHERGIKIIWDHVSNHISINHPWMENLPTLDWIHGTVENHLDAWHHKMVLSDIHGDPLTYKYLTEGWFVDAMPDLNQKNPFMHNYIIQNTIWWIEYSGLDGIREDTYPYADQKFLSEWAKTILNEYPNFNIVGEVWTGQPAFLAFYQTGSYLPREYDSHLPSVTDFGFRDVMYEYLKGKNNLYEIFQLFAKDNLYPAPDKLVTFIDNHDVARVMLAAGGNVEKAKIALTILMTSRGIPQILYATEIGMVGAEEHGILRSDFPGGFSNSSRNAFCENGRTDYENDMYNFLKELLMLRKKYPALSKGKMIHFPPFNNIYLYLKEDEGKKLLVIINDSNEEAKVDPEILKSVIGDYNSISNVRDSEEKYSGTNQVLLKPVKAEIFFID